MGQETASQVYHTPSLSHLFLGAVPPAIALFVQSGLQCSEELHALLQELVPDALGKFALVELSVLCKYSLPVDDIVRLQGSRRGRASGQVKLVWFENEPGQVRIRKSRWGVV